MLNYLDNISKFLNKLALWLGGITLVAMVFLTCANIFLRFVWVPVKGTFELMGFFGAIITAFALGATQIKRGHIAVSILVDHFSNKLRSVLSSINYFICMVFFATAAWQIAKWATTLKRTGEITETLRIIYYPFTYGLALGCALLSLALLVDFLKSFSKNKELQR